MANISIPQLLIVLVIVMLVFGAKRLPKIGDGLGKAIRNLKRGLQDDEVDATSEDRRLPDEVMARKERDIADLRR